MSDQNEIALSRYPRVGKAHLCLIYIISFQVKGQGQMVVLKKTRNTLFVNVES